MQRTFKLRVIYSNSIENSLLIYTCDWACENQYLVAIFHLCPYITHDPFEITIQIFTTHAKLNGEPFKAYRMLMFYLELDIFIVT